MARELDLGKVVGRDATINGENAINLIAGKNISITQDKGDVTLSLDGTVERSKTASKLETPRTIQTNLSSTESKSFDGSNDITPGVTGILPISYGGTGASNAENARNLLGIPTVISNAVNDTKEWANGIFSNPNLLINGDFQVWQRGTSFEIPDAKRAYTADRFLMFHQATCNVQKDMDSIKVITQAEGVHAMTTLFECPDNLKGETLTLSFYAKASENINFEIHVWDSIPYNAGKRIAEKKELTLTQTFQRYSITFKVPQNLPQGLINFWIARVGGAEDRSFWIKKVKLEIGDIATPFVPKSYAEELRDCQRYYFRSKDSLIGAGGAYVSVLDNVSGFVHCNVSYPTEMRVIPTETIYSVNGTKNKISTWGECKDTEHTVSVLNTTRSVNGFNCIVKESEDQAFVTGVYNFHVEADAELY